MQTSVFRFLSCIVICFVSLHALWSQEPDREGVPSLQKRAGIADEAIGVQTKGQLQNLIMNYGQITDTRYEDVGNRPTDTFFDFRYPRENFTGLCDDFAILFAVQENSRNGNQGNVIDGWTDNDNEDWIAKDGAYGRTHYSGTIPPNQASPHAELKWNNATPYLAHSDLPDTWPVDETGTPFWPGLYRRHPASGIEIPGEFASDRDIYLEFTDGNNQQGDRIGIEVTMMTYSYGRVYAEDFLFYEIFIINKSGRSLQGAYAGFYQDPDCSDHGEEALLRRDSTFADGSVVWSIAQRDFDGDIGGATRPNALGITEDYTFGTAFLETPRNLGVTDFHYFLDSGPTTDAVLWPIVTSDPTNPNIIADAPNFFHGADQHFDDVSLISNKQDWVWIVATGPFDMAPGDTVKFTIVVIAGDDDADYYSNLWQAKEMFDAKFNGPAAPPSPRLSSVTGDRRVTLYWDDSPESALDPSTGEQDFEGYKIYRSEDGGITWGNRITDAQGRTVGYVPIAQFDLANNIKGPDPKNPLIYLGDDTGLRHSWVDSTVINGISYSYTIISYDRGTATLPALEGAKGDGPEVRNFITATPVPSAMGRTPAQLRSLSQTSGSGTGIVNVDVVDPDLLSTMPYRIKLEGTPASTYTVTRVEGSSEIPLLTSKPVNAADAPVVDGFRLSVMTDGVVGGIKSVLDENGTNVLGAGNISPDSSWYVSVALFPPSDTVSRSASYAIEFSTQTTMAYSWGLVGSVASFPVPFSVRNVRTNQLVCFEVNDLNQNSQWDEGETIFATRVPYPDPPPTPGTPNPATSASEFAYQISILNAPGDPPGRPPVPGTVITVTSFNALRTGDAFELEFAPSTFNPALVDLSQIRVVPNPYIVTSRYESQQNVREIRFMYLPPECTITVYTVSGIRVKTLHHASSSGSLSWNLVTDWDQALSFGVYVYVVDDPQGNRHLGKFALIK